MVAARWLGSVHTGLHTEMRLWDTATRTLPTDIVAAVAILGANIVAVAAILPTSSGCACPQKASNHLEIKSVSGLGLNGDLLSLRFAKHRLVSVEGQAATYTSRTQRTVANAS